VHNPCVKSGEQSGEQIHPNEAGSPHLKALAPICKLLRKLKQINRGRLSKPPHSATLPPLRRVRRYSLPRSNRRPGRAGMRSLPGSFAVAVVEGSQLRDNDLCNLRGHAELRHGRAGVGTPA
jgi:hypothetical protein